MKSNKSIKTAMVLIALCFSIMSASAQIYPQGVSIRIFQPEEGGFISLKNNQTGDIISSFEVHINQGFDNEEKYYFASVPPFVQIKIDVSTQNDFFVVKEINLNNQALPLENPVFQGWRDGEVYDVSAVIEKKQTTSLLEHQSNSNDIKVYFDDYKNSIEVFYPENRKVQKLELYNMLGRKMKEQTLAGTKATMFTHGLSGIYIVRIGNQSKKIIINH